MSVAWATLDAGSPLEPDPLILANNLEALRSVTPHAAQAVENAVLPEDWRPAIAMDDSPSWITRSGAWLGGTAIPLRRAMTMIPDSVLRGGASLALPGVMAGGEIEWLLSRLPRHAAVFVSEYDAHPARALLSLRDWSKSLRELRLLLLIGRGDETLREVLLRYPGLAPPGQVLAPPYAPRAAVEALHQACLAVIPAIEAERRRRLESLQPDRETNHDHSVRIWIAAHRTDSTAQFCATLLSAACESDPATRLTRTRGPADVGPLFSAERLDGFHPTHTLCVGHAPAGCPLPAPRPIWWHVDAPPRDASTSDALHLAATPTIRRDLREAGVPPSRIADFFFAAAELFDPERADFRDSGELEIVLFADRPDPSPESRGIHQPTHRILWQQLQTTIADLGRTGLPRAPEGVLRRAEQESNTRITRDDQRLHWLQLVRRVLIPAVEAERILRAIATPGRRVRIVGRGWTPQSCAGEAVRIVEELTECPWSRPDRIAIFAWADDPLHPALPTVAAAGWPILLQTPAGAKRDSLGELLHPDAHYTPFTTPEAAGNAVNQVLKRPTAAAERARRAADHVRERHTCAHRLAWLKEFLAGGSSPR